MDYLKRERIRYEFMRIRTDELDIGIHWLQQYTALLGANQMYQVDLAESLGREKKLREAIEKATSRSWSGDMSALLDIKNELKASLYPKEDEAK